MDRDAGNGRVEVLGKPGLAVLFGQVGTDEFVCHKKEHDKACHDKR
jgi:hypothetical protein